LSTGPDPKLLVDAIFGPSPAYKRAEVDAIVSHREAVTPLLLERLARIAAAPEREEESDLGPLYTVVSLAHFHETAAHDDLVRIARLPIETFERLLGEGLVTEQLDAMLLATAGDRTDGLRAILTDASVSEFIRAQAASALAEAVVRGHADRGEVLSLMAGLLTEDAAPPDADFFWDGVISAMLRLKPVEQADAIRRAFDAGLVPDGMMSVDDFEAALAEGPVEGDPPPEDVHDWIGWWDCFRPRPERPAAAPKPPAPAAPRFKPDGKLARNGPCWCGSGRKYKGCHYDSDQAARHLLKLSAVLPKIAEPLIEVAGEDPKKIQIALTLAALAWNESRDLEGVDRGDLEQRLGEAGRTVLDDVLPPMIKAARRWRDDRRIVTNVEVIGKPGGYTINVTSIPIP